MSLKDHPFAAVSASAAVTTVALAVVFSAVIPTWLKSKDNEIAALQKEPDRLKGEIQELKRHVETIELDNLRLRGALDALSPDSLFCLSDVYPKGYRAVRIGDRIDMVSRVYAAEADVKDGEGDWVSVTFKKPGPFSAAAYYYEEGAKLQTVTHVLFQFEHDSSKFDLLKTQLIDTYGRKEMMENAKHGKTNIVWSGILKHTVELGDGTYYISPLR